MLVCTESLIRGFEGEDKKSVIKTLDLKIRVIFLKERENFRLYSQSGE